MYSIFVYFYHCGKPTCSHYAVRNKRVKFSGKQNVKIKKINKRNGKVGALEPELQILTPLFPGCMTLDKSLIWISVYTFEKWGLISFS